MWGGGEVGLDNNQFKFTLKHFIVQTKIYLRGDLGHREPAKGLLSMLLNVDLETRQVCEGFASERK